MKWTGDPEILIQVSFQTQFVGTNYNQIRSYRQISYATKCGLETETIWRLNTKNRPQYWKTPIIQFPNLRSKQNPNGTPFRAEMMSYFAKIHKIN